MRVALFGPPWFYFFWGDAVGGLGHFEEAVTGFYHGVVEQVVGFLWVVKICKSLVVEVGRYGSVPVMPVVVVY
jgi:hypothetical protein